MNVRINKRENPFVQVDKTPINDTRLSPQALGVLTYLLSKPDGWRANKKEILKRFKGTCIRTTINMVEAVFREMRETGYAKLVPVKGAGGRIVGSEYVISEVPEFTEMSTSCQVGDGTEVPTSSEVGTSLAVEDLGGYSNNDLFSNNDLSFNDTLSQKTEIEFESSTKNASGSEGRYLQAMEKITLHLKNYPDTLELIRGEARRNYENREMMERIQDWVRYYCDNVMFSPNAEHRLRFGNKSFVWWLKQRPAETTKKHLSNGTNNRNSETAAERERQRAAGAFAARDQILREHGIDPSQYAGDY